jgi:hypothetical protein
MLVAPLSLSFARSRARVVGSRRVTAVDAV